jgi:DNA ligase-1
MGNESYDLITETLERMSFFIFKEIARGGLILMSAIVTEKNMMHGVDYLGEDVSNWLISEKLDGCRAYWDGKTMWSRGGCIIILPAAMSAALPRGIAVEGEIFAGREEFEVARRFVQYARFDDRVQFHAFDLPNHAGTFAERYEELQNMLPVKGICSFICHVRCNGIKAAVSRLIETHKYGGEGLILRNPSSVYQPGRVDSVLKLKSVPDGYDWGCCHE